ncbi:MAG: cyclodeaminase/cyclohydrolase family protein [Thermomicrobiales bacterium]
MQQNIAGISTRAFIDLTADPDVFCGGGSVAAVTAAGAAATALLVLRLNVKRRANASVREGIQLAIATTEAAIEEFLASADDDISTLAELLAAQRALKAGGSNDAYLMALTNAAESPLRMAERIASFLDVVEAQLPISSRFTVSDLGAAAVLAEGAARAALLTAEVNIALLGDANGSDPVVVRRLEERRAELRSKVVQRSIAIEESTRVMMLGTGSDGRVRAR